MTATFVVALALLLASPWAMRLRYGRDWLLRPYGLLVAAAVVYHGISETVIRATGAADYAPWRAASQAVDHGMLVAAAGLLAMTLGYVALCPPASVSTAGDLSQLRAAFDWRITGAAAVPLFLATVAGRGYASGNALEGEGVGELGLAVQFFLPLVVLTAFGLLLRWPRAWLWVILGQSVVLAAAGQRLELFVAAVALVVLGARVGIRPSGRQLVTAALVAGLLALAISSIRADAGRGVFQSESGADERLAALWEGLAAPEVESVHGGSALEEAALRLDSNAWAGAVMAGMDEVGAVGPRPVVGAVLTSVPSALYPDKLTDLSLLDRSPELAQITGLRLVVMDYLPGHVTTFLGALGPWLMLLFNLGVGGVLGLLDRACTASSTPWRLVGTLLLVEAAMFFERGIDFYLVAGRAFLVLAAAAWVGRRVVEAFRPTAPVARRWRSSSPSLTSPRT